VNSNPAAVLPFRITNHPSRATIEGLHARHGKIARRKAGFEGKTMATGWANDGAVQEQIDATIKDGIARVRSQLPTGPGLSHCEECEAAIPEARRKAIAGVRLCVACQEAHDREQSAFAGYNRRGSKDSQLR
jgi:phage/conjugal plasmid C-4 type zinc finger TraR family protein